MSEQTLEARVTALEKALGDLQERIAAQDTAQMPFKRWWERERAPMTDEDQRAWFEASEYGRYFRRTGHEAPPDWKPGDPIPEPDEP